jgi:hypothetical protein
MDGEKSPSTSETIASAETKIKEQLDYAVLLRQQQKARELAHQQEDELKRSSAQRPAILYFEDPTYVGLPDEETKAKVRAWRFTLERRFGLYNADLWHVCTSKCFPTIIIAPDGPIASARRDEIPQDRPRKRRRLKEEEDEEKEDDANGQLLRELEEPTIEAIDLRLGLYGCPRSGRVHYCSSDVSVRQKLCRNRCEHPEEGVFCLFSGRLIDDPDDIYNIYEDDTAGFGSILHKQTKSTRDARDVAGEGRKYEREIVRRDEMDFLRERAEKTESMMRARLFRSIVKRKVKPGEAASATPLADTPLHARRVIPPATLLAASPVDRRGPGRLDTLSLKVLGEEEAEEAERSSGKGRKRKRDAEKEKKKKKKEDSRAALKKTTIEDQQREEGESERVLSLSHGLFIEPMTLRCIRRVVIDLLADEDAHAFTRHRARALNRHQNDDSDYLRLCTLRAATVFAFVKRVAEAEKKEKNPEVSRRTLHKRQAMGIGVVGHDVLSVPSAVELTISTLYAYSRGLSLSSGESCLIMPDPRLQELLPPGTHLPWYGLTEARRNQIVAQSDPRRPSSMLISPAMMNLLKGVRVYNEKMPTGSLPRIQHAISIIKQNRLPILGINMEMLGEILNVMLPDYSALRADTETDEEEVTAQGRASPTVSSSTEELKRS